MRNVVYILALLCTVYTLEQDVTDSSNFFERLVNQQKKSIESILNGLLLFEERLKQNLEIKLDELKADALLDICNIINATHEFVNLSIHKGKEEGKNVDECYIYVNNLESKNVTAGLEACIQNGYVSMKDPLANISNSIEEGKKFLTDLDAIIPNCHSASFLKMKFCIIRDLILSKTSLKRIISNSKKVKIAATNTYAKTITDVKSCITKSAVNINSFITDIIINSIRCVKNAPKDNPSTTLKPTIFEFDA